MSDDTLRRRLYKLLSPHEGGRPGRVVDAFILVLIVVNVVAVTLETVANFELRFAGQFYLLELFSVAVFSIEYVARLWTAVEDESYSRPMVGRLRFAARPLLIIDLLAILPFYLVTFGVTADLRFLRALRLIRIFRILKVAGYSDALDAFRKVLTERKEKLVISVSANFVVLLVASSVMYLIEHPVQPEAFSSIPATLWWGVATLTTVGYGDVVPVTMLGQFVGGIVAVLGIGMFAIPAALIATGFVAAAGLEEDDGGGSMPG